MEADQDYKARAKELMERLEWDYNKKKQESKKIIKKALKNSKNPIISSSFGKDSVLLIHLVHSIDDSIPIVFNKTGVQFQETLQYKEKLKKKWDLEVNVVKPKKTFWEIVEEYGYPKTSRNSKTGDKRKPKCCYYLKEEPMKRFIKENEIDLDFVGLIGDEGRQRRWAFIQKGSYIYKHKAWNVMKCIPLIFWTEKDIWEYYDEFDLPKNPAYEKYGIRRTGCKTCTGHIDWKKKMAKHSPDLLKYILKDKENQTTLDDLK